MIIVEFGRKLFCMILLYFILILLLCLYIKVLYDSLIFIGSYDDKFFNMSKILYICVYVCYGFIYE